MAAVVLGASAGAAGDCAAGVVVDEGGSSPAERTEAGCNEPVCIGEVAALMIVCVDGVMLVMLGDTELVAKEVSAEKGP